MQGMADEEVMNLRTQIRDLEVKGQHTKGELDDVIRDVHKKDVRCQELASQVCQTPCYRRASLVFGGFKSVTSNCISNL